MARDFRCGIWEEVLRHNIMRHCYSSGGFWSPFQIMCLIETCLCYIVWLMFWPSMQDVTLSHCLKVRLWKAIWRGTAKDFLKNYIFWKTWCSCFKGPPLFLCMCVHIHTAFCFNCSQSKAAMLSLWRKHCFEDSSNGFGELCFIMFPLPMVFLQP